MRLLRKIDGFDLAVYSSWIIFSTLLENGHRLPQESLRKGLEQLPKIEQFNLTIAPDADGDLAFYALPEGTPMPVTFHDVPSSQKQVEMIQGNSFARKKAGKIPGPGEPLWSFEFIPLPEQESAVVYFSVNHAITDGRTMFELFARVLEIAVSGQDTIPEVPLFASREDFFSVSSDEILSSPFPPDWAARHVPFPHLERIPEPKEPTQFGTESEFHEFDGAAIVRQCRAHGCTVQGLLCALHVRIVAEFIAPTPPDTPIGIRCMVPMDLRRSPYAIPAALNELTMTSATGALYPFVDARGKEFWDLAREFSEQVRAKSRSLEPLQHATLITRFLPRVLRGMADMSDAEKALFLSRPSETINASSVGKIPDKTFGPGCRIAKLFAFPFTAFGYGPSSTMSHAFSVGDRLFLSQSIPNYVADAPRRRINEIVKETMQAVIDGLDVAITWPNA
eukprot:gnl/Chilomastix_cuspidata/3402.p1 GENE.gnl/Chilomastix_cuspidata/3402~~gnl/Chilomastix_cuspidata/3402.p1  ORF type:complete len:488 (-),score=129.05 gnl/Chilomastix_cuspidata/3402:435-1784(-)